MARLLVTGGAGYVGSHALRALLRAGHAAVVIDDLRAGRAAFAAGRRAGPRRRRRRRRAGRGAGPQRPLRRRPPLRGLDRGRRLDGAAARVLPKQRLGLGDADRGERRSRRARLRVLVVGRGLRQSRRACRSRRTRRWRRSRPTARASRWWSACSRTPRAAHGLRYAALRYFNAAGADPAGGLGECHEPETHLIPLALRAAAGRPAAAPVRQRLAHARRQLRARLRARRRTWPRRTCARSKACSPAGRAAPSTSGTGAGHTVREVLAAVERTVGRPVPVEAAPPRPGDPAALVADPIRFQRDYRFSPRLSDLTTIVETAWAWERGDGV